MILHYSILRLTSSCSGPVHSDSSLGVLIANTEFYRAFREGDIQGMDKA